MKKQHLESLKGRMPQKLAPIRKRKKYCYKAYEKEEAAKQKVIGPRG